MKKHTTTQIAQSNSEVEETFRILIESVKDYGIFLIDPQGYIQSWNSGASRINGYDSGEAIGKHFSIFYTPDAVAKRHPDYELEQAKKFGRYEEEGWRVRKNGTKFWANVIITALRNKKGELIGFGKITRDLTEKKEAEERLKLSEERARRMFEGVKEYAMIMLNPDGTIASWNEGARRIKGYEAHEILGKYFAVFYPEQDVQMGKCEYELQEAALTGRFEDEGWRLRKDGTKFWASVLISAIRDEQGNLLGFSKVTRDMTDRKRTDDLLKMAYSSLEKRVEERTRELTETNKKLTEAVKVRDEFLSIASHELRTPLTPLKLQVQGLMRIIKQKSFNSTSEERLERMADTCDKAVSRLANLIENLLDVSRINMGKLVLHCEPVDMIELAQDMLERFKTQIQASGCEVTLFATPPIHGHFDHLRLEQVFMNLLTNALKYGSKNPVSISLAQKEGFVEMIFRDHGIGIAKRDQERIFLRFERVKNDGNIGGLGLGLYITKQIVEAHGGTIHVESVPYEGTSFIVKLPVSSC